MHRAGRAEVARETAVGGTTTTTTKITAKAAGEEKVGRTLPATPYATHCGV